MPPIISGRREHRDNGKAQQVVQHACDPLGAREEDVETQASARAPPPKKPPKNNMQREVKGNIYRAGGNGAKGRRAKVEEAPAPPPHPSLSPTTRVVVVGAAAVGADLHGEEFIDHLFAIKAEVAEHPVEARRAQRWISSGNRSQHSHSTVTAQSQHGHSTGHTVEFQAAISHATRDLQ